VKKYPNSELAPRTYYSLGDSYYNLQQYVAAEKSYREVLRQFRRAIMLPMPRPEFSIVTLPRGKMLMR